MKKIFAFLTLAVVFALPLSAQLAPINGEFKNNTERKMMRKSVQTNEITSADLVGTFEAHGVSAFENYPDEDWTVVFVQDAVDPNKLWITPIMQIPGVNTYEILSVYAFYDQSQGTLSIPLGQCIYGGEGQQYNIVIATTDEEYNPLVTGDLIMTVTGKPDNIRIENSDIFGAGNIAADEWWYNALFETVFSRVLPDPLVYVVCKDGSNIGVRTEQLFFNEIDNDIYVCNSREISNDPIAGTYTAFATSAFQGGADEEWTVEITYDENDKSKVWIHPLLMFVDLDPQYIAPVYGTFDANSGSLIIPLGQTLYGGESEDYHFVLGSADNNYNPVTTGNLQLQVNNTGSKTTINIPYILGVGNLNEGADGWWYQALGYTTYTRNSGILCSLADIDIITRNIPTPEIDGFFVGGQYYWDFEISDDGNTYEQYVSATKFNYAGDIDLGSFYQGAEGVIAHSWSVNNFMADLGFFGENGVPASFMAYSYKYLYEGQEYEFLDILDDKTGLITIGTIELKDKDGTVFTTEVYLGDYDGQGLYTNLQFVVENNVAQYNGTSLVFWFMIDENPYMLADLKNVTINNTYPSGSTVPTEVNVYDAPVPVKLNGVKQIEFKK